MTDKAKARLRAIPLVVCSIACVACSIPIALHTANAQVVEGAPMSASSLLTMSHLGTYEITGYFDDPGTLPSLTFSYNVPRCAVGRPSHSITDYPDMRGVNSALNWEFNVDGDEQLIYFHSGETYVPSTLEEVAHLRFMTSSPFNMSYDMFVDLLGETHIYMPVGYSYNFNYKIEYRQGGDIKTLNGTIKYVSFYTHSGVVDPTDNRTLWYCLDYDLKRNNIRYTLNDVEYVNIVSFQYEFVPSFRTTTEGAIFGTNDIRISSSTTNEYSFYDLDTTQNVYIDYLTSLQAPPPTAGDTLLSPLTAFFGMELFDGFTMGSLLTIALGCLLFGLFLKIFAGG